MPAKHSLHVALTAPLARYVSGQVEAGAYASASDLIRTAVRLLMTQDEARAARDSRLAATPPAGIPARRGTDA